MIRDIGRLMDDSRFKQQCSLDLLVQAVIPLNNFRGSTGVANTLNTTTGPLRPAPPLQVPRALFMRSRPIRYRRHQFPNHLACFCSALDWELVRDLSIEGAISDESAPVEALGLPARPLACHLISTPRREHLTQAIAKSAVASDSPLRQEPQCSPLLG